MRSSSIHIGYCYRCCYQNPGCVNGGGGGTACTCGTWINMGACSETCGTGTRSQMRTCTGTGCTSTTETRIIACNTNVVSAYVW